MRQFSIVSIMLLLFCYAGYGQISTREEPVSFRTNIPPLAQVFLTCAL